MPSTFKAYESYSEHTTNVDLSKCIQVSYDLEQPTELTEDDMVTVIVGTVPALAMFHMSASALQSTSEFFARALKPEWTTDSNRTITLPEVDVMLFKMYTHWLATGAEILINEDDWITEYWKYLDWQQEVGVATITWRGDKSEPPCPDAVWNFNLTTKAWFLGDYLQSRDFQNHCMSHLYYMHRRFDHCERDMQNPTNVEENYWHWGTIAYFSPADLLYAWEMTAHLAPDTPFLVEHHPLRKFFVDWLTRYWAAFQISECDHEAQDGIVKLIALCPDLGYKQLRSCTLPRSELKDVIVQNLGTYWIDDTSCSDDVRQDIERYPETHFCSRGSS